jgi:hypothetical protein
MTVYVESNFVLEQALEQEQCESCEALVKIDRRPRHPDIDSRVFPRRAAHCPDA